MDDVVAFNRKRWGNLARLNALFTRPWLDLDAATALKQVDPWGQLGDVRGKNLLCLASGGGQQSAAFSLAGAHVTVFDLAPEQLARDQEAATHYGHTVQTVPGDMRDLSAFDSERFDIVFHPYSITFVPDCRPVFFQVARILRPGGIYALQCANPFAVGVSTRSWNGRGFDLTGTYHASDPIETEDEVWVFTEAEHRTQVARSREYRHHLSAIVNGLVAAGFTLERLEEERADLSDETIPGSWEHLVATLPPWLFFWARRNHVPGT